MSDQARFSALASPNGNTAHVSYDGNGRLIQTARPVGSVETITYNAAGQMVHKIDEINGTVISEYVYTYDANGNITEESADMYAYDSLDRMTGKNAQAYVYDPGGNMTEMGGELFGYGAGNRLTSYDGQALTYDADGNMTYGPLGGGFAHFEYDELNRLIAAGDTEYAYDGEGTRISSGDGNVYVTNPIAELSQLLMSTDGQGNVTYYVYGLGLISQETVWAVMDTEFNRYTGYYLFHYHCRQLKEMTGT